MALRVARDYRIPPTRYLQLPWAPWGEVDYTLTMALAAHERSLCPCGCGQPADVAHDDDTEGRWQVEVPTCYAKAAIDEFMSEHSDDLDPGQMVGVRLLPEGEEPRDPLAFDPEMAARYAQRATTTG